MTGIVHGVFSDSVSAVLASVNMTIWNGTTIENTHTRYTMRQNRLFTREMYHAAMDVHTRISAVDSTVMISELATDCRNG